MASTGTVIQVIGSTFDAQFPESDLPSIYNAVYINFETRGVKTTLVGEVAKWEQRRNRERALIDWLFTVERARDKLGRAYPRPTATATRRVKAAA